MAEVVSTQVQLLRGSAGTLSVTFYDDDGVPSNPGVTGVIITDSAGSVIYDDLAIDPGGPVRSGPYTSAGTAQLDTLTFTWDTANLGTLSSQVEIVGAFLFGIAEARRHDAGALANPTAYPTATIEAARARITERFTDILGFAPVPRYTYLTDELALSGDGGQVLFLPHFRVSSIRSITERTYASGAGTDFDAAALADLYLSAGSVYREALGVWTTGRNNYRVGYEHGLDTPPEQLRRAALEVVVAELVPSSISRRALDWSTEMGTVRISVPDPSRGRWYGLPDVDAVLAELRDVRLVVA